MKRSIILLTLCLATALFAKDTIKIAAPTNGATVSPLTFTQRFFIKAPIDQLVESFQDPMFLESLHSTEVRSIPDGIKMQWQFKGDRSKIHYELLLSENEDLADARLIQPPHSTYALQNLIPGMTYFWCVQSVLQDGTVTAKSDVSSFTVEDLYPRVLALPDCWNVRDLGGRTGIGGRKMPYGLIFRSGGLNYNSSDGGKTPGKNTVTADSIKEALEVLKIHTEIDLRWDNEVAGMTQSPLGPTVQYIHIPTTMYGALYTSNGMDNFATLFRIFTNPENYPIDFHCIAGADRTGTLAFLLESVMGWSEEDIRRDYTYTTHYSVRKFEAIDSLIHGMDEYGTKQEPLQWKAERFLLRCGITPAEIAAFQRFIFGADIPMSPALENELRVSDLKDTFDLPADCKVIDNAPVVATMTQCGKTFDLRPTAWKTSPVKAIAADKDGRVLITLDNRLARTCTIGIQDLPKGEYTLVDFLANTEYACPGTKTWTAEALAATPIPVLGKTEALLIVSPAGLPAMANISPKRVALPDATAPVIEVETLGKAPVIDGKKDASFEVLLPLKMTRINGTKVADATRVYLATNPAHDTLYVYMDVADSKKEAVHGDRDSDAVWRSDCVELFFGNTANDDSYHIIVSRLGDILDEKNRGDSKWDVEGMTHAVAESSKGWTFEAAVPLSNFDFDTPITLNACQHDMPGEHLRNLNPTGGDFHNPDARHPLLMK